MRPKGSQAELESRRLRMLELQEEGTPPAIVAELLRVSQRSVRHWNLLVRNAGPAALKRKPIPGRPRKLSREYQEQLKKILKRGGLAAGFSNNLWTGPMVAQLIAQWFGVRYHIDHVGRLLRTLGCSLQKINEALRPRRLPAEPPPASPVPSPPNHALAGLHVGNFAPTASVLGADNRMNLDCPPY